MLTKCLTTIKDPRKVFTLGAHQYLAVVYHPLELKDDCFFYSEVEYSREVKHIEESSDPMHEMAICGLEQENPIRKEWVRRNDPRPWCEACLEAMREIGRLADEL